MLELLKKETPKFIILFYEVHSGDETNSILDHINADQDFIYSEEMVLFKFSFPSSLSLIMQTIFMILKR